MENTIERVAQAIQNNEGQLVLNGVQVTLPAPQTHGTMTQQRTYARIMARGIVENNLEIVRANV